MSHEKESKDVLIEIEKAQSKFDEYRNSHEGYAIIAEELDELWDEVKKHSHDYKKEYHEAMQVACTAMRYMHMCRRLDGEI